MPLEDNPAPPPFAVREAAAIAAFCVLWSLSFPVTKLALADCPPLLLLTIRLLAAGTITLAIAAAVRRKPPLAGRFTWRDGTVLAALGILNNACYLSFNYLGTRLMPSGLMALIVSANPVLTAVLAAAVLGEAMTVRRTIGLLLGVAGVAVIVHSRLAGGTTSALGVGLAVAALVSMAAGTVLYRRFAPAVDVLAGSGVQMLAGGLVLAPVALALESPGDIVPTARLMGAFAYIVLGSSVAGWFLWFRLVTVVGATRASAWHFLMPPLGMAFGMVMLGEPLEATDLLGVVPVAAAIYLVTRPHRGGPLPARAARSPLRT